MNTWKNLYDRLNQVDLEFEAAEGFNEVHKDFERLNAEQMYMGKRSDGQEITPAYAPSTIERKKRKGQPFDRVTLRDTGLFHSKIIAYADNEKIYTDSDVDYTEHLVEKYTEKIFGLDRDSKKEFAFGPYWSVMKRRLSSVTGLKFNQ